MTIDILPLGIYQANCYILSSGSRCIAIDPGGDAQQIAAFLQQKCLTLEAILLTHGHFDHVGGVEELVSKIHCQLWMHQGDYSYGPEARMWFPLAGCSFTEVHFYEDGDELTLAGLPISILATPGHTWGSVCIAVEDNLFTGDTLFQNSCGRTDLEGGDIRRMQQSLRRLKKLDRNYTVYPGHGSKTTLDREKRVNPYMR